MKSLIIAEKPSVAGDIAKSLGGFKRSEEGYERDDAIITNAIGHLVGIDAPEGSPRGVPCIPDQFDLVPNSSTKGQLSKVVKLINRKDIDVIVNACDAGREGELIFRRIVAYAKSTKAVKRMWLQSMTAGAIREAYSSMRTDAQMRALSDAAFARAEADWIVGINGSRVARNLMGDSTPVGRVMTPTLMIMVNRELAIANFVPTKFWEIHANIGLQGGVYLAKWTSGQPGTKEAPPNRLLDRSKAQAILDECQGKNPTRIIDETKPGKSSAPHLFDLTTLQREANRLFGFSASDTLAIAQALYEKHKALTYPRTDARALPEDYIPTVIKTIDSLGANAKYASYAKPILEGSWVKNTKKVFDNSKISDHFAIIPTGNLPAELSEKEAKIYDLVVRRFLAIFYPDAGFSMTTRTALIASHTFIAKGKVLQSPGWLAVYDAQPSKEDEEESTQLPALQSGEIGIVSKIALHEGVTKPPSRFTEASLLSAMENAGKEVDSDELRDAMSERGLGTPATRAATIDKLLDDVYIKREKKLLIPTDKAFGLRDLLLKIDTKELLSPELTGEWEYRLKQIEAGKLDKNTFMSGIKDFTLAMVARSGSVAPAVASGKTYPCPSCAKPMRRIKGPNGYFWGCSGYQEGCKTSLPDNKGEPGERPAAVTPLNDQIHPCPVCKEPLRLRSGAKGAFWGCSGYPKCKQTLPDDGGKPGSREGAGKAAQDPVKTGQKCPECKKGELIGRITKTGKSFIGCTHYPNCKYVKWP